MRKNLSKHIYHTFLAVALLACTEAHAQDNKIQFSGSIQSDVLLPEEDEKIGTEDYSEWGLTNTFVELNATSKYVDAGARLEYLEHPLPGFEKDYAGWGVPYFYVKGKYKNAELTLGNFYEQFGSGFILRTYEERSLGIDNSLRGGRLVYKPFKGVTVKALGGQQRRYWDYNDSWVMGGDVELNIDQWSKKMQESGTYLTLGASIVDKYEEDEYIMVDATHRLNLPTNVLAYDLRANLQTGNWNILAEYAQKSQDPNEINDYIYRKGYVAMLSTSYSKSGMSMLVQAKRSDNMGYRSMRRLPLSAQNTSYINHLPAFTLDHTYTLAAHYPYATNPDGEWAYQAELTYNFKRRTLLGGKYGTKVKVNFSHVHSIEQNPHTLNDMVQGSDGYGSAFWKWGDSKFYQDFNVQIEKKLSKDFKLNLMYMNQYYNKTAVEGHGGMIHSDIFVAEGKYKLNNKLTLRGEAQYLSTKDDQGDWAFGLLELSFLPNWMFTVSDEWNCGETDLHYYNASVTFTKNAHRLQLGYARTREGFNCSGGVCRWIPASKGVTLSYNYNF
ncbi:MAG: hypothetical protein IJ984_07440 [Prevotella sp.]|nr:hypothetical protein [Prevotella sp.]MBR2035862.1 hypothetical protein [Prevotella sp.]MBR6592169.1 hypothetical protein [Prevotella sp.]